MTNFAFDHLSVPDIRTPLPGPNGAGMLARHDEFVSPSYTPVYPLFVERGSGAVIEDVDGNLFLDFTAGIAVTNTGHCHPQVVAAIKDQADKLLHMSGTDFYYQPQIDLAQKLAELAPGEGSKLVHRRGFSPLVPDIHHVVFPRGCQGCIRPGDGCTCVKQIEETVLKRV